MIKEFHQQPGDFFLGFAIGEIGLSITSLVESSYDADHNDGLDTSEDFCFWIAIFRVLFRRTIRIYHACYIIYYIVSLKSSLKSSNIPRAAYHVIPWLVGIGLLAFQIAKNSLGKTLQGTYDVMSSPENDRFKMELVICVICFVASMILITKLSSFSANLFAIAKRHFTYYLSYFICANIFLITTLGAKVYGVFALRNFKKEDNEANRSEVVFSEEAVILIDTISPVILTSIRIYDPFLTRLWIKLFIKIFCFCRKKELAEDPSGPCPWSDEEEESEDFEKQRRTTSFVPPSNFLAQVRDNYRVQAIYSLLAAIHDDWKSIKVIEEPEAKDDAYYNKEAKEEICFDISAKIVKEKVPYVLEEIRKRDFPLLAGKLTVYSPEIFQEIRKMDGMDQDLINSLDLGKNFNRILKSAKAQGGRGGEFFFFSSDNRLILKTVNTKELDTLLGILPRFSRHFQINPKSIIGKIYAAFTFEVNEPYEKYHLILMKNINEYPSSCTLRKYDLKGSTVDRRVIKQKEEVSDLKAYGTMKDQDFDQHEGRLYIKEEVQYDLLDTIVRDVAFFRTEGLIGYSLAVYLVDRERAEIGVGIGIEQAGGSTDDLSLSMTDDNEEIRDSRDLKSADDCSSIVVDKMDKGRFVLSYWNY